MQSAASCREPITEYIIRTRQPVLIRDNYVGGDEKNWASSLCARPVASAAYRLVAYVTPFGAMAVYSDHERVFDEGHLELLRVLASESEHRN